MFTRFSLGALLTSLIFTSVVFAAPADEPTKVKLIIQIPPEVRARLSPDGQKVLSDAVAYMQAQLFLWGNFKVELPRPVYEPGVQIIELAPLLAVDAAGHVKRLALDEAGNRRALTERQWEQLRQESIFSVQDPQNPRQFDVWKVTSSLVHKGNKEIRISFQAGLAGALDHITVQLPEALVGNSLLGVLGGIRNILFGIRNSLSLLAGLTENNPRYTAQQINELVEAARAKYAAHASVASETSDEYDILSNEALLEKALPIIQSIRQQADAQWTATEQDQRVAAAAKGKSEGLPAEEFPQVFANNLEARRMEAFFELLQSSPELQALDTRLATALVRHTRALTIVRNAEREIARRVETYRAQRRTHYAAERPILSRVGRNLENWVEGDAKRFYQEIREEHYSGAAAALSARGLDAEAKALVANLDFLKGEATTAWDRLWGIAGGEEAEMRRLLGQETVPARKFEHGLRIWSAKNWIVTSSTDANGKTVWSGDAYTKLPDVYTNSFLWRLQNAALRTASIFKLGLYGIAYLNWVEGPLGIKSLFLLQPFEFIYMVDPDTGKIVADSNEKMSTLFSRIVAGDRHIRDVMENFAKREDTGMIPKRLYAPLHTFWHGFIRRLFQPLLLSSLQVSATAVNTAVTGTAVVTAPLWAPLTALFELGFNATVYDYDAPRPSVTDARKDRTTNRLFPILSEILGRSTFDGIPRTAGGAAKALVWNPALAMGHAAVAVTRWGAEKLRDAAVRGLLWLAGARIPAQDPSFFLHRTQGDGVTDGYFFKVTPDLAMAALLARLEIVELHYWEIRTREIINLPYEKAREVLGPLAFLINGSAEAPHSSASPIFGPIHNSAKEQLKQLQEALDSRMETLQKLIPRTQAPLKMTADDFEKALSHGAAVVEAFLVGRVFENWTSEAINAFWTGQQLTRNDWRGLTKNLFAASLGEAVLTPIETTQQSFIRNIEPVGISEMVGSVLSGNDLPTEARETASWDGEGAAQVPAPYFPTPTAAQLCAATLADYGKGMSLPPAKLK